MSDLKMSDKDRIAGQLRLLEVAGKRIEELELELSLALKPVLGSSESIDNFMTKQAEQIKILREALLLTQLYVPANLIDSEVVREALEATKE